MYPIPLIESRRRPHDFAGLEVKYISTRGDMPPKGFREVLLEGLAPDGGLVIPERYPQVTHQHLEQWRNLPYAELAFQILRLFAGDIPETDLLGLTRRTYTAKVFGSEAITPLKTIGDGVYLLALSNGPTFAFKDMA